MIQISGYSYASNGYVATISVAAEKMTAGLYYQFSYYSKNSIGNSLVSNSLSVPVADTPSKASAPTLLLHNETSITVTWSET